MSRASQRKAAAVLFGSLFTVSPSQGRRLDAAKVAALTVEQRNLLLRVHVEIKIPVPVSFLEGTGQENWLACCGFLYSRNIHGIPCRCHAESDQDADELFSPDVPEKTKPAKDVRTLRELLQLDLSYNEPDKNAFIAAARKFLKAVAKAFPGAEVAVNISGIACSGEVSLSIPGAFYAQISQGFCGKLMARFGKAKFACDGRNEWLHESFLDDPERLAAWIRKGLAGDRAPSFEADTVNGAILRAIAPVRPEREAATATQATAPLPARCAIGKAEQMDLFAGIAA